MTGTPTAQLSPATSTGPNMPKSFQALANEPVSPTSPTSPLAQFPPLPPVESRSRAPEFYGFVAWSVTHLGFVLYCLWAILPDDWIVWLGVTWYPNREWALLVPSWTVVVVLLTYFTYFAMAIRATPAFSESRAYTDTRAQFPDASDRSPYLIHAQPDAIPEAYDIPIGMVNRVLYGPRSSSAT